MANPDLAIDFAAIAARINNPFSISLENSNIFSCVDEFIKCKSRTNPRVADTYHSLNDILYRFQKILRFNIHEPEFVLYPKHISDELMNCMIQWLKREEYSNSYTNRIVQKLKIVLDWSGKHGAKTDPSYCDAILLPEIPERELLALTLDDVSMIYHFDLRNPRVILYNDKKEAMQRPTVEKCGSRFGYNMANYNRRINTLERVRDAFVLSCCLGQRFSDMRRISKDNFHGDTFRIVQQKTGNTAVVDMSVFSVDGIIVHKILQKYDYKFPFPHCIQQYNKALHALFKSAGFNNDLKRNIRDNTGLLQTEVVSRSLFISSHTARRTFATTNLNRGINSREVRIATGHRSESAFVRYDKGHIDVSSRV